MRRQRGVALAMLLWFVAAMLLLVGGIVAKARMDVSMTRWQLQAAQAAAAGDGASLLLLRDLLEARAAGDYPERGIFSGTYIIGEKTVTVHAVPTSGLVDLNGAGEVLLTDLFVYGAGLDEERARLLAERIIAWRTYGVEEAVDTDEYLAAGLPHGPRHDFFMEREDLLQVLGVSRTVYQRVAEIVHAGDGQRRGVDPMSAPGPVLVFLAAGDTELARAIELEREQESFDGLVGYEGLLQEHLIGGGTLRRLRVDAQVAMPDGKVLQRRRWVDVTVRARDGLPWRVTRTEPVQRVESVEFIAHEGGYGDR